MVTRATCLIALPPALAAAFLTFYGGFIILFLVACVGVVVPAAPLARHGRGRSRRPDGGDASPAGQIIET